MDKKPSKDRVLALMQVLQKHSDEETWLTTNQVLDLLLDEGHDVQVRTLRRDVQNLKNCGYDIGVREKGGSTTSYAWLDREWTFPELQVLVDAVSAAHFIPAKQSRDFIRRLSQLAGPSCREDLKPRILISERVKAKNKKMILSVQTIHRAIQKDKKIAFKYLQYSAEKQQVPRHTGTPEETYVVSPYATVWNNDRYYLVGFSDKRQKVAVFRIDRMDLPKQLQQKRIPAPDDFDVRNYTDRVFQMFDGPEEQVTLRCRLELMDHVIDRFGEEVKIRRLRDDIFEITVPVRLSTTFYAWVFKYVGKMRIAAPEYVRKQYMEYLQNAMDEMMTDMNMMRRTLKRITDTSCF